MPGLMAVSIDLSVKNVRNGDETKPNQRLSLTQGFGGLELVRV
jgi:hypothetical protein